MTTYYVSVVNGDDANAGTGVGTAFKTLEQVTSVMGAGDTAYFEAGHYPGNAITFAESGADENNRIKFIGDIKGDHFSNKGAVNWAAITAPYSDRPVEGNSYIIQFTGDFIHLENINSFAGSYTTSSGIYFIESSGHYCYRCTFNTVSRNTCLKIDWSLQTADIPNDTIFESCTFMSLGCYILTPKLLVQYDMNLYFKNCLGLASATWSAYGGAIFPDTVAATGTLAISGIRMYHCSGVGGHFLQADGATSGFGPNCESINNLGIANYVFNDHVPFSTAWDYPGTKSEFSLLSNNNQRPYFTQWHSYNGGFVGGVTDLDYYRKFGTSPFQQWEPYHSAQKETFVVGAGSTGADCPRDMYGIRRGNSPRTWLYGHFNGATSITDPDSAWNIEANAFTWSRTATGGTLSSAQGTDSTNHVIGIGMDPENLMNDDGVVHQVKMLITAKNDGYSGWPYATADLGFKVISGAETLYNSSWTLDIPSSSEWQTHEISLSVPTGGWTHAKILALEVRFWQDDVHVSRVSMDSILIRYQVSGTDTPGCVQSYQRPVADAVELYLSNPTVVLTGAGMQQILLPCPTAASYTITVPYKFDANYTGTKPIIEVKGMVGQDMQTDTATGSSGSWNTDLSVTVTPTEAGFVCVQVYSLDTSGVAECWFGQVSISEPGEESPVGLYMYDGASVRWDSFAGVDDIGAGPDFTIEGWFKVNSHPGGTGPSSNIMLMHKMIDTDSFASGWSIGCGLSGGKLWCWFDYTYDPATELDVAYTETTGATNFDIGSWVHLAIVNDDTGDGDLYFYVNGVSGTYTAPGVTYIGPEIANFRIGGGDIRTGWSDADIEVMGVQISNYAKYLTNFTPPTRTEVPAADGGHLLMIPFNEGSGSDAYDIDDVTKGTLTASGGSIGWGSKP